MRFRVHFEYQDGTEDSIVASGETVEDCQNDAAQQLTGRNVKEGSEWSEPIK